MEMTKKIKIRNIYIGGGSPVAVQSMTNTDTADREKTLEQIKKLVSSGCEIVRFTVNSMDAVRNIPYYIENTSVPLVADIHFDHKLALESVAAGISITTTIAGATAALEGLADKLEFGRFEVCSLQEYHRHLR